MLGWASGSWASGSWGSSWGAPSTPSLASDTSKIAVTGYDRSKHEDVMPYWNAINAAGFTLTAGAGEDWHNIMLNSAAAGGHWIPFAKASARGELFEADESNPIANQRTFWTTFVLSSNREVTALIQPAVYVADGAYWQVRVNGRVTEVENSIAAHHLTLALRKGENEICITASDYPNGTDFQALLWGPPGSPDHWIPPSEVRTK